jgi:CRP/FNR family cyclic AMP-dependent transcriptional regulator
MPLRVLQPPHSCTSCEVRSLRLFCNLSGDALVDYAAIGVDANFQRGATLFSEGSAPDSVLVMCSGQVKLSCTSREGKTLILKMAMPGDVLGLGAVLSGTPYEVSAETVTPTRIKSIRRSDFLRFIERHGEGSLNAARSVAEEYKAAFADARRLALSGSAAARLASVLLEWGKASTACGEHQTMRFTMALTHEELANLVGSSRETMTRMLGRFRKERLIEVRGASILILSPERLEQMGA